MNEIEIRPGEQLVDCVAKRAFPNRVQSFEVTVEACDTHHVERQIEESLQLFFGAFVFHEVPDLCADGRQHSQEGFIRLADFMTEEFQNAGDNTASQNGQSKGAMQAN